MISPIETPALEVASLAESKTGEHIATKKPRVVLVEDDSDVRNMLERALLLEGYEVVALEDGLQLMCLVDEIAREELVPPDFIVSDIRMPHFSGLDMLFAVQRISVGTPIILISAFCDSETRRLAEEGGAAALLAKPLDPQEQLATLEWIRLLNALSRANGRRAGKAD